MRSQIVPLAEALKSHENGRSSPAFVDPRTRVVDVAAAFKAEKKALDIDWDIDGRQRLRREGIWSPAPKHFKHVAEVQAAAMKQKNIVTRMANNLGDRGEAVRKSAMKYDGQQRSKYSYTATVRPSSGSPFSMSRARPPIAMKFPHSNLSPSNRPPPVVMVRPKTGPARLTVTESPTRNMSYESRNGMIPSY